MKCPLKIFACMVLLFAGVPAVAQEAAIEAPRGLWQTEPDALGVVLHVRTRGCGRSLCGRVERAKNRRGYDAPSDAVGEKLLWNLRPQPDGAFLGEYRGPTAQIFPQTRVRVEGQTLRLRACHDDICKDLIWKRIR